MPRLRRKTKSLIVRPLAGGDYEAWKAAHTSLPAARNKWDRARKAADESTRAAFKKILAEQARRRKQDQFYDLAIFDSATGALAGGTAIMDVSRGVFQSAYLGYYVFSPHWGRGVGKEAALATIDIAFRELKLHRIEAGVEPGNRRSIRLARSIGLRKEGVKKNALYLRGRWNDLLVYSATCEEFGIAFRWKKKPKPRAR